jgi:hypothetical protein
MAVGLRLTFADATQEQYDAVHGHMNLERDPPSGLIFHCAGPIEGGWGVTDVWESRQAFDRFASERLAPNIAERTDEGPAQQPDITEFVVDSFARPWHLRLGRYGLSASASTVTRAREAVTRLTSSREPPADETPDGQLIHAGVAAGDPPADGAGSEGR